LYSCSTLLLSHFSFSSHVRRPTRPTLFPYTTLFRSHGQDVLLDRRGARGPRMERERVDDGAVEVEGDGAVGGRKARVERPPRRGRVPVRPVVEVEDQAGLRAAGRGEGVGLPAQGERDRSDGRPVLLQPGQGA